jgi:RNA polymerase sigma-70 factor (ECF subfamily)
MLSSQKTTLSLVKSHQSRARRAADLIPWIARGDEAAFRLFYEATNGLLFGLLLRVLGHTQTAEHVLSELYEEVRQKASRFGTQNERPLTWLIFMAHRRAIECLCQRLITRENGGKIRSITAFNPAINITEQRRLIRATMDSIPGLQQEMIELIFFSGMTNLETAKELGLSAKEVEEGLRCAMLQLFRLFRSMNFQPVARWK